MTTTLKPSAEAVVAPPPVPVEEHPDLRALPRWPGAPVAGEPTRRSPWWMVAIGVVSLLVGLTVGFAIAWWMRSDDITRLENQAAVMNSVPYGGFKALYSAPREHLALADTLAAGGAQGSWQTASNGTRTFLYYPSAQAYGRMYSAPREHLALADTLAAGGAQGSWQTASNGTRTFLYYPTS